MFSSKGETMKIIVNGSEKELSNHCSISDLTEDYSLDKENLIVLKNDVLIKYEQYSSVFLTGGEKVELLSIVGGG